MKSNTNIQYRQVGDFNIPNFILPPEEASVRVVNGECYIRIIC